MVNVVLLHERYSGNSTNPQLEPILEEERKVGTDGTLMLDTLSFSRLAANAPGGRYLLIAYPESDSLENALTNLVTGNVPMRTFQLPPRISGVEFRLIAKDPNKIDSLQSKWNYEPQPGDLLQVQWYRSDQKYGDLNSVEALSQDARLPLSPSSDAQGFSLSRFVRLLPASNIFDALDDDRQGMKLHAPQPGALTAFPGLRKVFPGLSTPTLEFGTYKVEIYLNGVLEGTKEVKIP
jgi:hypothetical protein